MKPATLATNPMSQDLLPPSYVFGNFIRKTKHLSDVTGEPYHGRQGCDAIFIRDVSP
jgi:hypothetical protein